MTLTEEDMALIRRIVHDEFWEIFDSEVLPVLKDYVGTKLEASRDVSGMKGSQEEKRVWNWDPQRIAWSKAQGSKGEYERSEDLNSLDFKAMLKDLAEHKGSLTRDGVFYWIFPTGSTVGKKKREES